MYTWAIDMAYKRNKYNYLNTSLMMTYQYYSRSPRPVIHGDTPQHVTTTCHSWWHPTACHHKLSFMLTPHIMLPRPVLHCDTPQHATMNCHSWWHPTACHHELSFMVTPHSMSPRTVIHGDTPQHATMNCQSVMVCYVEVESLVICNKTLNFHQVYHNSKTSSDCLFCTNVCSDSATIYI